MLCKNAGSPRILKYVEGFENTTAVSLMISFIKEKGISCKDCLSAAIQLQVSRVGGNGNITR